ncbi:MAG: hypothetical protein MSC31_03010 [Solirubrobacteraceae bacterium MAG38_C4-C5]|nr:hypothetical protein [Candidatus Siliceabacter maunaloa]
MTTISEQRQHLDFDAYWSVVKWDAAREYIGNLEAALHGLSDAVPTKASDVVGVSVNRGPRTLLVAEFKDYEHTSIPASQRAQKALDATSDKLMAGLVRKVIDTLCGATFAHDGDGNRSSEAQGFAALAGEPTRDLLVLFCIEVPRTQAVAVLAWTTRLQKRLSWLGPRAHVIVTNSARPFSAGGITYRIT